MVVYGMMRLGIRDDRLMKIVTEHLIRTGFDRAETISIVNLAYAYSKLEYWNENVFASLGRSLIDCAKDLTTQQIVMASLCFAQSAGNIKESHFVMDELIRNAEKRLQEFDNRSFSTIAFAAGKYNKLKEDLETFKPNTGLSGMTMKDENSFAKEIMEEVKRRTFDSFTMTEINLINYSLMRMKCRDEDFLQNAAEQFVRNAAELGDVELVNAIYAFGRLEFVHLQFVHAMVAEVKRRNLLEEMSLSLVATLVYSLAICRIYEEEIMDQAAVIACKKVHEFEPQAMSMLLYGMAVLNATTHAEPLVSAVLEDLAFRYERYESVGVTVILWSSALLSGSTSGIWALKTLFHENFWSQSLTENQYTMLYSVFASLKAEEGIQAEELEGWYACRRLYEESTGENLGMQNRRLAERLALKTVAHQANAMVPALPGHREAGIRADIVIEKLKLVIEVEGPQRMTIPLDKAMVEIGDNDVFGLPEDVISEVRSAVECGLTGSAAFKRRLLRQCGWRVVTVSFDENEEYVADALGTMGAEEKEKEKKDKEKNDQVREEKSDGTEGSQSGESGVEEEKGDETDASGDTDESTEAPPEADTPAAPSTSFPGGLTFTGEDITEGDRLSAYEKEVRAAHQDAVQELRRRILEERGNAAASAAYSNHLEYRRWQVRLEKDVFKEMLAAI
uniref:RAP domain-containing protein n=1 Tax=Alexandrium catenella TaxID=2925 RepID=A0A7S1PZI4_ALECA